MLNVKCCDYFYGKFAVTIILAIIVNYVDDGRLLLGTRFIPYLTDKNYVRSITELKT